MKFGIRKLLLLLVALLVCTGTAFAVPVIDGSMSDWATSSYTDGEETFGNPSADYVGPGYGGQAFDVEKIGLQFDGTNVYFGLQTGFDLLNGVIVDNTTYTAGDIFIDFGSNGSWDVAIGMNLGLTTVSGYSNPSFASSTPYAVTAGTPLGSVSGVFGAGTNTPYGEDIYTVEGMFDLAAFGLDAFIGQGATIHWTMSCGNDVLEHTASVPEPSTLFLLGAGLIGLSGFLREAKIKK